MPIGVSLPDDFSRMGIVLSTVLDSSGADAIIRDEFEKEGRRE